MINKYTLAEIIVVVFLAGIGLRYFIFYNMGYQLRQNQMQQKMSEPEKSQHGNERQIADKSDDMIQE